MTLLRFLRSVYIFLLTRMSENLPNKVMKYRRLYNNAHRAVAAVVFIIFMSVIENVTALTKLSADRLFDLHPNHVWHGIVRSKQIGDGDLTLCADVGMWNVGEADQVCHDLGFRFGAMLLGKKPVALYKDRSVKCIFLETEGIFCSKYGSKCTSAGWVSCQFPGFLGCFPFDQMWLNQMNYHMISNVNDAGDMTIEICIRHCHANNLPYAGLEDGTRCYCGQVAPLSSILTPADKSFCMKTCPGNQRQACGGSGHIAVYDSALGSCNGTYAVSDAGRHFWYLASPGFPGYYDSPVRCQWMYNVPYFNNTVLGVIGMDFSQGESLRIVTMDVVTGHTTSDETLGANTDPFVERGNWSLDLLANTLTRSVALIFIADASSDGNRQFLITFTTNTDRSDVPPMSTVSTPMTTKESARGEGHPNKKNNGKSVNGWVFAIIVAAIIILCVAIAVGIMYYRNREAYRNHIFHQSQERNEGNIYGDVVGLQPDIDKQQHEGPLADIIDENGEINTTSSSNNTSSRLMTIS